LFSERTNVKIRLNVWSLCVNFINVPSDNSFASVPPTSYNGWKEYSLRTTQLSALYLQAEVSSVSARRCRSSDEVLSNRLPRTSSPMEKDPEGRRLQGILIMPGRMHSKNRSTSCARGFATTIISSIIAYVFPCDISRIIRCFISSCLSVVYREQPNVSLRMSVAPGREIRLLCCCCIINILNGFRLKLQRFVQLITVQSAFRLSFCNQVVDHFDC
ncbi:hypothetical protein D918_02592, partial [Trichuris suis]